MEKLEKNYEPADPPQALKEASVQNTPAFNSIQKWLRLALAGIFLSITAPSCFPYFPEQQKGLSMTWKKLPPKENLDCEDCNKPKTPTEQLCVSGAGAEESARQWAQKNCQPTAKITKKGGTHCVKCTAKTPTTKAD